MKQVSNCVLLNRDTNTSQYLWSAHMLCGPLVYHCALRMVMEFSYARSLSLWLHVVWPLGELLRPVYNYRITLWWPTSLCVQLSSHP